MLTESLKSIINTEIITVARTELAFTIIDARRWVQDWYLPAANGSCDGRKHDEMSQSSIERVKEGWPSDYPAEVQEFAVTMDN